MRLDDNDELFEWFTYIYGPWIDMYTFQVLHNTRKPILINRSPILASPVGIGNYLKFKLNFSTADS